MLFAMQAICMKRPLLGMCGRRHGVTWCVASISDIVYIYIFIVLSSSWDRTANLSNPANVLIVKRVVDALRLLHVEI
jgi:hypothetical protein